MLVIGQSRRKGLERDEGEEGGRRESAYLGVAVVDDIAGGDFGRHVDGMW